MTSFPELPSSPACERNRKPIFRHLNQLLPGPARILEIGAGTGQHAAFFVRQRPDWVWQCSDTEIESSGLGRRIAGIDQPGLPPPCVLDVLDGQWPEGPYDAVYTANTLHIMPWPNTEVLLKQAASVLSPGGRLLIYGPFHDDGVHQSESNLDFDRMLRARDPAMGVRDAVQIRAQAERLGWTAEQERHLPANNRLLVFSISGIAR